jgi:hypothetical protein
MGDGESKFVRGLALSLSFTHELMKFNSLNCVHFCRQTELLHWINLHTSFGCGLWILKGESRYTNIRDL